MHCFFFPPCTRPRPDMFKCGSVLIPETFCMCWQTCLLPYKEDMFLVRKDKSKPLQLFHSVPNYCFTWVCQVILLPSCFSSPLFPICPPPFFHSLFRLFIQVCTLRVGGKQAHSEHCVAPLSLLLVRLLLRSTNVRNLKREVRIKRESVVKQHI